MYAVIFKAEIKNFDSEYSEMAARLRNLALEEYGCTEFTAATEGNIEVAISYWPSKEHIQRWKSDPEHQKAQALGKARWYKSYRVQVVEVLHEYNS